MPKALKRTFQILAAILAVIVLAVGIYVIYAQASFYRIEDNQPLQIENADQNTALLDELQTGVDYTATTYNIGFGAYSPDYTFFLDTGVMADGTKTAGTGSRAASEESVKNLTAGAISVIASADPDFALFQEVDTDSDRSFHVNQKAAIESAFDTYAAVFAVNFHSIYLAYPILEPHGIVNAGLLTLLDAKVDSAIRRSYPIDEHFINKFLDLDRCFEVIRIPVQNGRDLVLINSHMSAYDKGGTVRQQQLSLLCGVLSEEYAAGNYVIAGGDWNHALCGSLDMYASQQQTPSWIQPLDDNDLPEGFSTVRADNIAEVASCRDDDIPYEKDVTYTSTVDGFIVSDNVTASAVNIDTGFAYSDHNPVELTFSLEG